MSEPPTDPRPDRTAFRCRLAGGLAAAWIVFAAVALLSCSTVTRTVVAPPHIPGAEYVGSNACVECHADIHDHFAANPHDRIRIARADLPGGVGCESCHGPASKHIAAGGLREFILNPRHDATSCFQCHLNTGGEFRLAHRHPVLEGIMSCVECHDPHGADSFKPAGALAMARHDESCAACHREQARPFVFEHGAMREGCITCHQPHGSINRKMLAQRDSNLCMRCHAQVHAPDVPPGRLFIGNIDHTDFVRTGACWSCHTAVHGSNVDRVLRF